MSCVQCSSYWWTLLRVDRTGSYTVIVKNCTAFSNKEKFYFILYEGIKGGQVVYSGVLGLGSYTHTSQLGSYTHTSQQSHVLFTIRATHIPAHTLKE